MSTSSEINAIYYAMRLISHRIDISQLEDNISESLTHEFSADEQRRAVEIIKRIQSEANILIQDMNETISNESISLLANNIEELAVAELIDANFDMENANLILEKFRCSSLTPSLSEFNMNFYLNSKPQNNHLILESMIENNTSSLESYLKDFIIGLVGLAALVIAVWQLMIFMGARDATGHSDMTLGMTNLYASILCFAIAVASVVIYFLRHPRVEEKKEVPIIR